MIKITEKIMSKVRRKETQTNYFHRCLNTLTCPKCGTDLEKRDRSPNVTADSIKPQNTNNKHLAEIEYNCDNCQFTHIRSEPQLNN